MVKKCNYFPFFTVPLMNAPAPTTVADEPHDPVVAQSAFMLYGMIHARFIVTARGLEAMYKKYRLAEFGRCPRTMCKQQPVVPVGIFDEPKKEAVKLYCPRCGDIYNTVSPYGGEPLDGAFFGTSFAHLFFMTFDRLVPEPARENYTPLIFGFKIHKSAKCMQRRLAHGASSTPGGGNAAAANSSASSSTFNFGKGGVRVSSGAAATNQSGTIGGTSVAGAASSILSGRGDGLARGNMSVGGGIGAGEGSGGSAILSGRDGREGRARGAGGGVDAGNNGGGGGGRSVTKSRGRQSSSGGGASVASKRSVSSRERERRRKKGSDGAGGGNDLADSRKRGKTPSRRESSSTSGLVRKRSAGEASQGGQGSQGGADSGGSSGRAGGSAAAAAAAVASEEAQEKGGQGASTTGRDTGQQGVGRRDDDSDHAPGKARQSNLPSKSSPAHGKPRDQDMTGSSIGNQTGSFQATSPGDTSTRQAPQPSKRGSDKTPPIRDPGKEDGAAGVRGGGALATLAAAATISGATDSGNGRGGHDGGHTNSKFSASPVSGGNALSRLVGSGGSGGGPSGIGAHGTPPSLLAQSNGAMMRQGQEGYPTGVVGSSNGPQALPPTQSPSPLHMMGMSGVEGLSGRMMVEQQMARERGHERIEFQAPMSLTEVGKRDPNELHARQHEYGLGGPHPMAMMAGYPMAAMPGGGMPMSTLPMGTMPLGPPSMAGHRMQTPAPLTPMPIMSGQDQVPEKGSNGHDPKRMKLN